MFQNYEFDNKPDLSTSLISKRDLEDDFELVILVEFHFI